MYLKNLFLKDFRNYASAEVSFGPKVNIIHGQNGHGKTNLLEALYLLATGRSFRTLRLGELIRQGASAFILEAEIVENNVPFHLFLSYDGQHKKLTFNGKNYTSFHPLLGLLPTVLYSPSDIELIGGPPAGRRRFFNLHLAQSDPQYLHAFTRYWQAMKERNALLRSKSFDALDCYEEQMAPHALYVRAKRCALLEELPSLLATEMKRLTPNNESLELRFFPSYPNVIEGYLQQLKKNRPREISLGLTLTGPHRDDFILLIEGRPARLFASEGQKKTATFALKLAEWARLAQNTGKSPLLGIDDFGLHLDEKRELLLKETLSTFGQVFLTTPYAPTRASHIHPLEIQKGSIVKAY